MHRLLIGLMTLLMAVGAARGQQGKPGSPAAESADWPQFLEGCVRYRQSLDVQAPTAPRTNETYDI